QRKRGYGMLVRSCGVGLMFHGMATNMVRAGHDAAACNRTPGREVEGARVAGSPAAAAQGTEVVSLCVSDTAAVESILFGPNGVEQSLTEGMIISDSSTIAPAATRKFAERVAAKGVQYVDSPVTGSKAGAES